jgi:hypothetical protein
MAEDPFVWGSGGEKLTPTERRRRVADAMMKSGMDYSPVGHWTQGAARVAQALLGAYDNRQIDAEERSGRAALAGDAAAILGGGASAPAAAPSFASSGAPRSMAMPNISPEMKTGIADAATALGISPVDLATTISYETDGTFDPTKAGPTTKWGQHRGLIQFGEPQAKQYGVDWSNPAGSQLGANGAIVAYLRDRGVKPGMGLMDIYSTINAGAPGLYDRSDAAAGGAPGTVADKVNNQMGGHRARAQRLFADLPAAGARPVEADGGAPGFFVPPGNDALPIMQPGGALPNFDTDTGRWLGPGGPQAAAPVAAQPDAVAAAPEQPQPLAPVFTAEGASQPWMGSAIMPVPPEPQVAQAAPVPLPPPRPADLAMPQADQPAPGAVPAVGQATPALPAGPDWSQVDPNSPDGGVGAFARLSAANAPVADSGTVFDRIAAALGGRQAPAASPSPAVQRVADAMPADSSAPAAVSSPAVERVAAAMPQQNSQLAAAARILNSPYANPGQRSIAQAIVERSLAPKSVQTVDLGNSIGVLDAQGNVTRQIPKTASPSKPTFGKIGVDANGDDIMGFIDPEARTTTPSPSGQPSAGAAGGQSVIPAPPPGVNGKIWREEQSKRAVENNLPASFDDTTKARNELAQRPSYKNMAQAAPIYKGMVDAAGRDNKASDLNLVYGLGKIMDPTSVVREGEMVMVKDTAALPQWLQGQISALNGGGRLTPETRRAIMQEAYGRLQSYEQQYNQDADFYRGIAKKRRMDPDEVVPGFGAFTPWQPAPPAAAQPGANPTAATPGQAAPVAAPRSKAEYDALPSGSTYMAPDGKQRVKP